MTLLTDSQTVITLTRSLKPPAVRLHALVNRAWDERLREYEGVHGACDLPS
jgi:hypothetical protein